MVMGKPLLPALGNYAAGDRFWDRQQEVADVLAYLTSGQSVLLTGPRRVGKTSVVHRVQVCSRSSFRRRWRKLAR